MKKVLIKKLADESFNKNNLDEKKVARIAKALKREDLKVYIKDLKNIEAKNTVKVTIPASRGISEMKAYFSKIYPNKKIVVQVDDSLLTGIKVVDYDNVYELSLKGLLESAIKEYTND